MPSYYSWLASLSLLLSATHAQLSGSVGPLTSAAAKAAVKTCNVLDYGATSDNTTDVGQPMIDAFADCGNGGLIYVPEGDYLLETWVHLINGSSFAIQLDGVLYRNSSTASQQYMIEISDSNDFELFSSTSGGAIQGSGYLYHQEGTYTGPRILHISGVTDWSVHDIALVDAPMFHFVIQGGYNGEVYNVMVTNKDECVTVKTDSTNIQIENIYCNSSGGCAIGSLGVGTNVSNVVYRNVYTWSSNQMFMFKSNGGSGEVSNVLLENFIGHSNAYSLDLDSAWSSMDTLDGDGVLYHNVTFRNWKGTETDGERRPPIRVICPDKVPCTDITIEDIDLWVDEGRYDEYVCINAYGSGYCLDDATAATTTYATTAYLTTAPTGYSAPTMANDLTSAFAVTESIPIPTIPTSFYPGATPYSALAGDT